MELFTIKEPIAKNSIEVIRGCFKDSGILGECNEEEIIYYAEKLRNDFLQPTGVIEFSEEQIFQWLRSIEKDKIDEMLLDLLKDNLIDMSVDENGEMVFWSKDKKDEQD